MAKSTDLTVSIAPNEIVFPNVSITIESRQPLDPESAQGGIVLKEMRAKVRMSRGDRMATLRPDEMLVPGHYTLLIGGLLNKKRQGIGEEFQIPFFVTDSRAKIPATTRVESMQRLRMHDLGTESLPCDRRATGKFVEIMKASSRKTGAPIELAFNERGRKVEPNRIFKRILENRVRKFGKVHETLATHLQKAGPKTRVPVALWLRFNDIFNAREKSTNRPTTQSTRQALNRWRAMSNQSESFAKTLEREHDAYGCRADVLAPVVYAELTPEQIRTIAKRPEVVGVFLHETEGIEDLANSIAIANSDDVHSLGFKGSGVKVAVWEDGPDVTTNLAITASYKTSGFNTSDHARHTHGIIKNIERNKPHGHAPSCSLHSANSKDLDALRWAAKDKGCTVISQSFHRSSEPGSATMSYDDIYKDWLALQWPYPTICQAAGNYWNGDPDNINPPSDEYVNHKGYNGLTVGNHNDDASAMSGDSVFRNPSSSHGDRELPEIAANGTSVTTVGLTMSGTSMAAPAVAGCAALIQNTASTLKSWPEGCRAILMAAAKRNVAGKTWWQDVVASFDASDGTGAVDALEGVAIARQRRSRNASATTKGWDVGTVGSSDFGRSRQSNFSYFVKLQSGLFAPRHVKVALAWDSKVLTVNLPFIGELLLGSVLTVDLDLQIFDSNGVEVGYSGSWENSYEIAEFQGKPGETYTIKIRRWSGTDDVWYGIAWTVTGGLFWSDVTRFTAIESSISDRRGVAIRR
jgi:hypothetical protein